VRYRLIFLFIVSIFILGGVCDVPGEDREMKQNRNGKKGILVVSFGTSYADTRALTLNLIEEKIASSFPDYEVRRAFTSVVIRKILRERDGIRVDDPKTALEGMAEDGFSEVIVQSTHILNGSEFHELVMEVNRVKTTFTKLNLGMPVLSDTQDYRMAIDALRYQLPPLSKGQAVVLMGHGTHHPANAAYPALQYMLFEEGLQVFIGTVEGYPSLGDVIHALKKREIEEVTLMPFMIVAGDHAKNDMAGEDNESWKNILRGEGFRVHVYLHGLGENPRYHDIFVKHVRDAISK
jgi:sirohydrochlorin cobaltochelatase